MKKICVTILVAMGLAGCGSKTDVSEKNFKAAMNEFFEKNGGLCETYKGYPIEFSDMALSMREAMKSTDLIQLKALEKIGYVKSSVVTKEVNNFGIKKKENQTRFEFTDAATPYLKTTTEENPFTGPKEVKHLCWGTKSVDKVVKWWGPVEGMRGKEVEVTYTYRVNDIADWAQKPEIKTAFPSIKKSIDGAKQTQEKHGLFLTNVGWEAYGLN